MKQQMYMRILLNRYHKGEKKEALASLGEEESKQILNFDIPSTNPLVALVKPNESLEKIHYTWFKEPFMKLSLAMQHYVFASLPEKQKEKFSALLNQKPTNVILAKPFREYFSHHFYGCLKAKEVLPLELLPACPLMPLATQSKEQLIALIDLIGVHDLVDEFRQIVDKNRLKLIIGALDLKQQQYLKMLLNQQEKWSAAKLGIDSWSGDQEKLRMAIHKRGLIRFAMALKGQNSDLIWHITHILDTGRAEAILKNIDHKESEAIVQIMINHILNALKFQKI